MANGLWLMVSPHSPHTHLPRFLRLSLRFRGCTSPDIFLRLHFYTNLPSKCQFSFASMMIFRTTLEMFLFYFPFPISSIFRFSSAISSVCVCVCVAAAANRTRSVQPRSAHVTEPNSARQAHVNVAAAAHGGRAFFAFSKIAGIRAFLQFSKLSILNKRCGNVVDKNYGIT